MTKRTTWWAWVVVVVACLFMASPIIIICINSFNASAVSTFPPSDWSLRWYDKALSNDSFRDGFVLSLKIAIVAATIGTLAGLGAAYALTRYRVPGRSFIQGFLNTPLSLPKVAVGLAGLIAYFTASSWLVTPPEQSAFLTGRNVLIVLHAAIALPLIVGILLSSLEAVDPRLPAAARDLGASPFRTFLTVTAPLIIPALLIAFAMSFMLSFDELESSLFMSSAAGNTLPVAMFLFLETAVDPTLAALSTLLLGATLLGILLGLPLIRRTNRRSKGWQ